MLRANHHGPRRIALIAWPILVLALAFPASASSGPKQGYYQHDNHHHRHHGKGKGNKHQEQVRVIFVPVHREKIREYFIVHQRDLPPYYYSDLGAFPPGIQRQLVVGRPLPPGIAMYPFPPSLDEVLGPPPPCCERVVIGRNAYLIDKNSNVILDILSNLIFR